MSEPSYTQRTILLTLIALILVMGVILCFFSFSILWGWLPSNLVKSDKLSEEYSELNASTPTFPRLFNADRGASNVLADESITRARATLEKLNSISLPIRDTIENATRLKGIPENSLLKKPVAINATTGDQRSFWVLNINDNSYRQTNARLVSQTAHLNFWIEEGVKYDMRHVRALVDVFENQIYPTNREIFGSELIPGVDEDERLVILYAGGLGHAAGYYSSKDSLYNLIDMYSNEAEMFYLSADYLRLDDEFTYGVLAHEFQHMIHWNVDRNETAWINEGLSELAVELNEFSVSGFDWLFAVNPDLQLNFWPGADQGDSKPHYGASYLFMKYLMDRFGIGAIIELAAHPYNGLKSIDAILASMDLVPEVDDRLLNAETVFQDWTIANIVQDSLLDDGIYSYAPDATIPSFFATDRITCSSGWQHKSVRQFGTDYLEFDCDQPFVIEVMGEDTVPLLPVYPYSGNYYFWSNYGDESSMKMSRSFDFTQIEGEIQMEYWAWFDIERDYDYAYLLATSDGHQWEILEPNACTTENPTGANYGCGYNGKSQGWILERVDLSAFAGQKITLMFEYLTDGAVNGDGLLLDNISIERIGYFTNFEQDDGGWQAEGFMRVSNVLPQAYAFSIASEGLIPEVNKFRSPQNIIVSHVIDSQNQGSDLIVVISGITRHTRIPAFYSVRAEILP